MSAFEQSAEERRLLLERAKRRAELRAEFLKQTSNPFRHGEGGTVVSLLSIGKQNSITSYSSPVVLCHQMRSKSTLLLMKIALEFKHHFVLKKSFRLFAYNSDFVTVLPLWKLRIVLFVMICTSV